MSALKIVWPAEAGRMNDVEKELSGPHEAVNDDSEPRRLDALLGGPVRTADQIWTKAEYARLLRHLHNENKKEDFVMSFNEHDCVVFRKAKNVTVDRAINWAWQSITGAAAKPMAFAPYSRNGCGESRWAAFDFDAHDGENERARTLAFAAFQCVLNGSWFCILERSGGGWHLWIVDRNFHPVAFWIRLLKSIARDIGAPIRDGVCEIFPSDSDEENIRFGRALRAPGSWHALTRIPSGIVYDNVEIAHFSGKSTSQFTERRKKTFSSSAVASPVLYSAWPDKWRARFSIVHPSTRNEQLARLVGEMFHQLGHDMARRVAETQYAETSVVTRASLPEHLESFGKLWRGLFGIWLAELPLNIRAQFEGLTIEHDRDAFRILWSYRRRSCLKDEPDFPVAVEDLGNRLGLTLQGAAKIRDRLAGSGIIRQTQAYRPNVSAARYRWVEKGAGI